MGGAGGFFRRFIALAGGYWTGEEKWTARWLTFSLVILTIAQVASPIMLNVWSERLFDALEQKDMQRFVFMIGMLGLIILGNMTVTTLHLAQKRKLQVGWRAWLTHRVMNDWMVDGRQYQVNHLPGEHDNPDGRIAEDARISTEYAFDLAHSLFYAVLLLISFTNILWVLSGTAHVVLGGVEMDIPGHLVWVAVIFAAIGTSVAILLGRPLVWAVNNRQTHEANFRFGLVHARENAQSIALLHGETDERRRFRRLFRSLWDAWDIQTRALIHIFLFTSGWSVLSTAFPVLIAAPRYIAGTITLGVLMQTAQAFQQMESALSWPIDNMSKVAEWKASVERVLSLFTPLQALKHHTTDLQGIGIGSAEDQSLSFEHLSICKPDGKQVIAPFSFRLEPGERVMIDGEPTAAVMLFKAVAGLWPWGGGDVHLPAGTEVCFMTQRPYLPIGTMRDALCYPAPPDTHDDDAITTALKRVKLAHLCSHLNEVAHWEHTLTLNEQQRLGFARILLHRPGWLFIEEATDALGIEGEDEMMALLQEEFPQAAVLTISHHSSIEAHHQRKLLLKVDNRGHVRVSECPITPRAA